MRTAAALFTSDSSRIDSIRQGLVGSWANVELQRIEQSAAVIEARGFWTGVYLELADESPDVLVLTTGVTREPSVNWF